MLFIRELVLSTKNMSASSQVNYVPINFELFYKIKTNTFNINTNTIVLGKYKSVLLLEKLKTMIGVRILISVTHPMISTVMVVYEYFPLLLISLM